MSTDYNTIAEQYRRAKQQPWRAHIEAYTLFDLIGDLPGKAVLDLACGEGFYTRLLRQKGAARAVGVDVSGRMIELARAEEAQNPLGVEYLVQDVKRLDLGERFDLVTAAYLLNYARTREELLEMCRVIARSLKPGGRFVAVNNNPDFGPEHAAGCPAYGLVMGVEDGLQEGTPFTWTFLLDDGSSVAITNYHLGTDSHEWAYRAAGFRAVRWQRPRLSPAGEAAFGRAYWAGFLDHPPVIFIECTT
jgi:SAM-dependent methyltransferase